LARSSDARHQQAQSAERPGVGAELGSNGNQSDLVRALRRGSQDSINQTGQQLVRRQINVQPTLTIRPGFPVRVIVNRDLVLAQYQG